MTDRYLDWLGIAPDHRPPTHYQLLGIDPSERDPDIITTAAAAQLRRIQAHFLGPDSDDCRRIAGEIIVARDTILDPIARNLYESISSNAVEPWWKSEVAPPPPNDGPVADWWKDRVGEMPSPAPRPKFNAPSPAPETVAVTGQWGDAKPALPAALAPITPQPNISPPTSAEVPVQPAPGWWKASTPEIPSPPPRSMPAPAPVAMPEIIPATPAPRAIPAPIVQAPAAPPLAPTFRQIEPSAPQMAAPAPAFSYQDSDESAPRTRASQGSMLPFMLVVLFILGGGSAAGIIAYKQGYFGDHATEVAGNSPNPGQGTSEKERKAAHSTAKIDNSPRTNDTKRNDTLPIRPDSKPKGVESKPNAAESKPKVVESKPNAESKPKVAAIPKSEPKPIEFTDPLTFRGHNQSVLSVALSQSGRSFLSIGPDKRVVMHSSPDGGHNILHQHNSEGVAVSFCDNDKTAIFCDGGEVVVYDVVRKIAKYKFFNPSGGIESMVALPDGSAILLGANDGCVRLWDLAKNKLAHTFTLDTQVAVTIVAVDGMGQTGAFGMADGRVYTFNLKSNAEIKRWKAHKGRITALALSADGRRVLSCGEDNLAIVWDTANGKMLQKFAEHKGGGIYGAGWCADGKHIVTGGVDKKICLWDVETGQKSEWTATSEERVFSLAIDAQDRFVLLGEAAGVIQLLPLPRAKPEEPLPPQGLADKQD